MSLILFEIFLGLTGAFTATGQQGYEGQPGNQGNGLLGYEGQPGNQGGH